jgi:hypothetical protein
MMTPKVTHLPRVTAARSHAPLRPSAAERWTHCPGAPRAERSAPESAAPSPYTTEGTAAHLIFALALLTGLPPAQFIDDTVIAAHLTDMVALTRLLTGSDDFRVEFELPPLPRLRGLWGTCDVITLDRQGRARHIVDLKYGRGVFVAAGSWQLRIYAALAARHFGVSPDGISVTILQPRLRDPVRALRYSSEDLHLIEADLRAAVARTRVPHAPRVAGTWCRFCLAAPNCPARQEALRVGLGTGVVAAEIESAEEQLVTPPYYHAGLIAS